MVLPAVTVRADVPDVLMEVVLNEDVRPFIPEIPETVSVAVPLKFRGVTARLYVAFPPAFTVKAALSMVSQ